jgi:hypothetical protein
LINARILLAVLLIVAAGLAVVLGLWFSGKRTSSRDPGSNGGVDRGRGRDPSAAVLISLEITKQPSVHAKFNLRHLTSSEATAILQVVSPPYEEQRPSVGHLVSRLSRPEDTGAVFRTLLVCDESLGTNDAASASSSLLGEVLRAWFALRTRRSATAGELRGFRRKVGRYYAGVDEAEPYQQVPRMILSSALQDGELWQDAAAQLSMVVVRLPKGDPLALVATDGLVTCLQRAGAHREAVQYADSALDRFDGLRQYPEYGELLRRLQRVH